MFSWDKYFFGDVGKKLKDIIRVWFYVEVILTVVAGAFFEVGALFKLLFGGGDTELFYIMLVLPIGVVISILVMWLGTLPFYGFAEIVDTAVTNRLNSDGEANIVSESKPKKTLSSYFAGYKEETKPQTAPQGPAINGQWKCTCGKVNPPYMSSCTCGKTAREIREMNKNQNN